VFADLCQFRGHLAAGEGAELVDEGVHVPGFGERDEVRGPPLDGDEVQYLARSVRESRVATSRRQAP
jgi:hypothetical protein